LIKGVQLVGVAKANAAFRALPPTLKDEYNDGTRRTLQRLETLYRAGVPKFRRILEKAVGSTFSQARGSGIVGIRKMSVPVLTQRFLKSGRADALQTKQPEFYARLVHDGGLHNPNPVPFALNAANAARDGYISDQKAATDRGIAKVSGGRFL
jgi:hypothetical protein